MKLLKKSLCTLAITLWANQLVASPWPTGIDDKVSLVQNWTISIPVLDNDIGHNLEISDFNATSVAWGSITLSEDKQSLNYKPRNNFVGTDEFWYVLKDDQGRTNAAKVVAEVVSSVWPEAKTDSVDATYDEVVKIPVLDNDIGTNLKVISVNEWSVNQGKAWISSNNEISYQQYGEARGKQQDEFWYVFEDQWGRKNSAKVIVSLTEKASTAWPTATPDEAVANNGLRVNIPVLENDIGDELKIEATNEWSQNGGKTRIIGDIIRYTPPANFSGTDSFWYVFVDNQGRTNSARVDVEVTENKEKSVVEFCDNTYETDGTKANTQLSNSSPLAPVSYPSTIYQYSYFTDEDGNRISSWVTDERAYYTERTDSESVLWMKVNGSVSRVSSIANGFEGQPFNPLASYQGAFYFVQEGRHLYSHDGGKLTHLGDLLLDLGAGNFYTYEDGHTPDDSEYINAATNLTWGAEHRGGAGDALHLEVLNLINPTDGATPIRKYTYLRISEDTGSQPIKIQTTTTYSSSNSYQNESNSSFYYFNGLDYYKYFFSDGTRDGVQFTSSNWEHTIKQSDNGVVLESTGGVISKFVEDRGRLFIITDAFDPGPFFSNAYQSKLFVVNNTTDELVELAGCE
ncbi:Ig-like domain-containing protein [Leucothrix pacifica]|uniref:Cadherin-like domain-containing protein n=1 Tax=Leucothrix pacifica TaxID=1247513 RepID=A0A317CPT2_9GAMM|nr:Ig-like domain-containing protein [Leucothrix pacifica]PWR00696.1 hypothetical protein DKW60_00360 [Leucothrix pacifica]